MVRRPAAVGRSQPKHTAYTHITYTYITGHGVDVIGTETGLEHFGRSVQAGKGVGSHVVCSAA
jgi:hypothetical protein